MPVVLSKAETHRLFENLDQKYTIAARLQYGAGLRLSELMRLRIKDINLERGTVTVRGGKGDKDRTTVLPKSLREEMRGRLHGNVSRTDRLPFRTLFPMP